MPDDISLDESDPNGLSEKSKQQAKSEERKIKEEVTKATKELFDKNNALRNKVISLEEQNTKIRETLSEISEQKRVAEETLKTLQQKSENKSSLSQDELLDLLYKSSLNERQTKIMAKYLEAVKAFEEQLGTDKFKEEFNKFFVDKIEQKLVAMKENKPNK